MNHVSLRVALLPALAASVCAQFSSSEPRPPFELQIPRTPIHSADPDPDGGQYGTWAAGRDYKVEFRDRSVRFVPYLGKQHPRTESWTWQTVAASRGPVALWTEPTAPACEHTEYRFEYRWPGMVERYDVLDGGVEQSFVLSQAPSGEGDLTITGRITSTMATDDASAQPAALSFVDVAGVERVRYGQAFAIDANGEQLALSTSYRAGRLSIHVDEAILQSASYPLLIDPLISTTAVSGIAAAYEAGDVAYDRTSQQQLVAYTRWVSSGDADMVAVVFSFEFSGPGTVVFSDISSSWFAVGASVACCSTPRKYVLAYTRRVAPQSAGTRVHLRDSGDLTMSTSVQAIPRPANTYDERPDVGGTTRAVSPHAMLVFERRGVGQAAIEGVTAVPLDVSGSVAVPSAAVAIESYGKSSGAPGFSLYRTSRPSIIKQARAASNPCWLVAFDERQIAGTVGTLDRLYLVARSIDFNGAVSTGQWLSSGHATNEHRFAPKLAGQFYPDPWSRFAIAYSEEPVGPGQPLQLGDNIAVEQVQWLEGASGPASTDPRIVIPPAPSGDFVGDIAFDRRSRSHWLLTARSGIHRVGFGGLVETVAYAGGQPRTPGGVDYYDYGGYCAVATEPVGPLAAFGILRAHVVRNPSPAVRFQAGAGCGSATMDWTTRFGQRGPAWDQQIGHRYTQVIVEGAPINSLHLVLYATAITNFDLTGINGFGSGCHLLVPASGPGFLGSEVRVQSDPELRCDLPLPATLSAFTLQCQSFYLEPGAAEFVSTQRLTVELAK